MSILGNRVLRREDPALITGAGSFLADLRIPELDGAATVGFVRSSFAHARIESIDVAGCRSMPGVLAVYTADDLELPAPRARLPWIPDEFIRPWIATDRVRFVGEVVAVVVAESAAQAEDAIETAVIEYEPLEAVVDPFDAMAADAPLLFDGTSSNIACRFEPKVVDEDLFAGCDVVVEADLVNQRLAAAPLEGRATAARWDDERATIWISSQGVHAARSFLAGGLGIDHEMVRVIAPDVGGGFGAKISPYPEDLLVAWVARRLGRPARWVENRSENMVAMGHGRDQRHHVRIGGTRDGRVLAYQLRVVANAGAYPTMAAFLPTFTRSMAPGTYDIAKVETSAVVVATNTMTVEAYRGAGRPEATAAIERAMDLFAAELGMDPVDVRRRNLLAAHAQPITTVTGAVYDAGNYGGALDAVLAAAGYQELRDEQARRRETGETPWLGIGVSTYVEITAGGAPATEFGAITIDPDGSATVRTGSSSHGQGHHTVWATLVSDRTGIAPERITVIHGDTGLVPHGGGTMGSRSLQLGGSAVYSAAITLVERVTPLAAQLLEAAPQDVVLDTDRGQFHVVGTPSIGIGWDRLAQEFPEDCAVENDFAATGPTFPFGAHVAVVEVDPDTGLARLVRHVACDDAGTIVNPLLADGQRHGGIAQGVAQALLEEVCYDPDGNPLTTTFADYTFISACELPRFELVGHETPTSYNPLGAKGIGESGTIGSTPAVQSAVIDAVAHLGVRHIDMPCSPERVWRAINS